MLHAKTFLKKCLFIPLIIAIIAMMLTTGCAGINSLQGEPGISIRWIGSLATAPVSPQLNDAYYNTANAKSYIWDGNSWEILAQDGAEGPRGIQGLQGVQGISIRWLGSLATAPVSPQLNDAYYNTATTKSYIWDSDSWEILAQDGISLADLETAIASIIADNVADLQEQITELEAKVTNLEQSLMIMITDAAILWGTAPDRIIFTWTVTNLDPSYEYWVYPHVGFTENSGPFGSTPEDEASNLEGMYDMAVTHYRPAEDGTGAWDWGGDKPTNPTGQLALLAYSPATEKAFVVDISEPIDTSGW